MYVRARKHQCRPNPCDKRGENANDTSSNELKERKGQGTTKNQPRPEQQEE
jgi:hypothetical protein